MKKIFFLFICLIFLKACANPEIVNIKQPEDQNSDCKSLENSILEAQKLKKDGEYAKSGTGGNVSRMILFWPAWAQSLHNADKAVIAADNRIFHLKKIMKNKKCANLIALEDSSGSSAKDIASQLKILKDLKNSGDLSKDEFQKAKSRILNEKK
tara:strand:- start:139 stop:600 length:462 start_codon:yes stop_codon:yes gene_type:complete